MPLEEADRESGHRGVYEGTASVRQERLRIPIYRYDELRGTDIHHNPKEDVCKALECRAYPRLHRCPNHGQQESADRRARP